MTATFLILIIIFVASVALFYRVLAGYQRAETRQRRLFDAILEYALRLSFYECRDFLLIAQTGDQAELERRWRTWAEFRDAALRGEYAWGIS